MTEERTADINFREIGDLNNEIEEKKKKKFISMF